MKFFFCFSLMVLAAFPSLAEVIEFPEEELASETVLPVFERAPVVKSKNITMAKRFEFGVGMGLNLTEALYNKTNFNANVTYHFSETQGVNAALYFMGTGLNDKGEQLKRGNLPDQPPFDPSLAPSPQNLFLLSYQINAFYGKISLTKNYVMNLSLYGLAGLGAMSYGDSTNAAANLGFGQNFYVTKNIALQFDMRLLMYQGPDPTSDSRLLNPGAGTDKRSSSDLTTATHFHSLLSFGLVYLL